MQSKIAASVSPAHRSVWVRLRTFIILRWVAIFGQIAAVSITIRYLGLELNLGLCFLAIGLSTVVNLTAMFVYPRNKRLSEDQLLKMFLVDVSQLAFLLWLTGGLQNPFSLLLLVPVAIAATVLELKRAVFFGLYAIVVTSLLAIFHKPLTTVNNEILEMPTIFVFGFWAAIVIGIVFLGLYEKRVTSEIQSMSEALLATQMALSREQKLTDLGGVIAATAHELGTPLATITLVSSEMVDELEKGTDLYDDACLIKEQADRCRDIMHSMGQAGKDDLHLKYAPISSIVEAAAEPHINRGKTVHIEFYPSTLNQPQPEITRQPEIMHGLRNLIQNAVDFSSANVWVDIKQQGDTITVKIIDDGNGFPAHLLDKIGDPFVRDHRQDPERKSRPGYEGMGLGLFIAKTLLERSGAEIGFVNGCDPFLVDNERPKRCGAIVEVCWPTEKITKTNAQTHQGLGENQPISV